jgi:mannose-6-phosphate isomerase-like protein (cupin superfamily)
MPRALLIRLSEVMGDPALQSRGDRKHLVTAVYPATEILATDAEWIAVAAGGKCPVQLMPDTESAVFNQLAKQTRHRHERGTEIYLPIEGVMRIEVEGTEYELRGGDMLVVNRGAWHEVKRVGEFLCRVVTVNCGGAGDRFES